jgi:hypothetical protein
MKVNPEHRLDAQLMQRHNNVLLDKNGDKNLQFEKNVKLWKAHIKKKATSNKSSDFAEGDGYEALFEMGTSIIPNIMLEYSKPAEQDEWWYMLLDELMDEKPKQTVVKKTEYTKWLKWYNDGAEISKKASAA